MTLSGLSATIDGVSLSSGNVVLLTGESTASENGPGGGFGSVVASDVVRHWGLDRADP